MFVNIVKFIINSTDYNYTVTGPCQGTQQEAPNMYYETL